MQPIQYSHTHIHTYKATYTYNHRQLYTTHIHMLMYAHSHICNTHMHTFIDTHIHSNTRMHEHRQELCWMHGCRSKVKLCPRDIVSHSGTVSHQSTRTNECVDEWMHAWANGYLHFLSYEVLWEATWDKDQSTVGSLGKCCHKMMMGTEGDREGGNAIQNVFASRATEENWGPCPPGASRMWWLGTRQAGCYLLSTSGLPERQQSTLLQPQRAADSGSQVQAIGSHQPFQKLGVGDLWVGQQQI